MNVRGYRIAAIARQEVRTIFSDLSPLVTLLAMPLLMIGFFSPVANLALGGEGGPEYATSGMAVMFGFFVVGFIGFSFFAEHRDNTWERLRASPARPVEIVLGKSLPMFAVALAQQIVLFGAGALIFGMDLRVAQLAPLLVVSLALVVAMTNLGVLTAAAAKTEQQLNVLTNLLSIMLAGIGGAMVPPEVLPGWLEAVAPLTPHHWALDGYHAVLLDGRGLGSVIVPSLVLLAVAVVTAGLAVVRFRFDEPKVVSV